MDLLNQIFGVGKDLTVYQMCARAFVFFFITLLYIRIAGMRTFGKKSSIDMIIVIVLGSVIARGIVGASGFGAAAAASAVLVLTHRLTAWITLKSKPVEKIIKGKKIVLYENAAFREENMHKADISKHDFYESLRLETQSRSVEKLIGAYLETNGRISFILKEN